MMSIFQLHYFLSQNIGGTKGIVCPPVQKLGEISSRSPLKLGPWLCVTSDSDM